MDDPKEIEKRKAEIHREHQILHRDPEQYIALMNEKLARAPDDSHAYFSRHYGWLRLNRLDLAYDDLSKAIELADRRIVGAIQVPLSCRGQLFMKDRKSVV